MERGGTEVKYFLLGGIFSLCCLAGFWIDEAQRKRINELEKFMYVFEILKAEIDYQLTPLKEACMHIGEREKNSVGKVFLSFAQILEEKESVNLSQMWQTALVSQKEVLHLKTDDYVTLEEFSGACGYLDKALQKRNLEMVIDKMAHEKKRSEEQYERCTKLNKSLGVLVGATLVILLI